MSLLTDTFGNTSSNVSLSLNSCFPVASRYGVTVDNLIAWNPSLSAGDCEIAGWVQLLRSAGGEYQ